MISMTPSNTSVQNGDSAVKGNSNFKARHSTGGQSQANPITPRKPPGYSFNNGKDKQPILRAMEYNVEDKDSTYEVNNSSSSVPLNFNFWMEHNHIFDRQVSDVIIDTLVGNNIHPDIPSASCERSIIKQPHKANNIVVVTVQDVDPRECNDTIQNLPFLNHSSCMPIRHTRETSPPLLSLDDRQCNNTEWQYMDVETMNSCILWTDKPGIPLTTAATIATTELLCNYILTFKAEHTLWYDDIILTCDTQSTLQTNHILAFQELARQKLLYNKDAPSSMLQLICSLTQAPQPGDLYGRCSKTRNKEPGMFLYRPGRVNTSTSTQDSNSSDKSQLYIIWQRIREIDVLDEFPATGDAHSLGFVKINPIAKQLTGAAGGNGGTGRWSEELQQELTLQLRCAVLKDNVSTTSSTVASTDIATTITATTTTATAISTAEPSKSPSSYFDTALQAQLRTQCLDHVTLLSLEGLVLTESMQDIMGYTTARVPGCEDYLSTSGRFYHPVTNTVVPNKTHIATAVKTKNPILEEGEELEDGEEEEVSTTEVEADTSAEVQQMQLTGVNTKTYFTEEHNNNSSSCSSSNSSSSDDEFSMAAVMANNLRKRKAQVAALASNEDTAELVEENVLLRGIPINYNNNSSSSIGRNSSSSGSAKKRKLTDSESPEEVVTLKSAPTESISTVSTHGNVKQTKQKIPHIPSIPPPPPPPSFPPPQQTKDATTTSTATCTGTVSTINTTTTYTPFILPAHSITTPLAVCALDCEMCTTSAGLELTRLTLICPINGVIYDTLVRPDTAIENYHTEFSGITKEALDPVTVTLADVQATLRGYISDRTIIVGHSADTDLKVLRLLHGRVVDTAALYPHPQGLPYKHSLKRLAKDYLDKEVQDGADGHDSLQDAVVALELALLKARMGENFGLIGPFAEEIVPKCSLFEPLIANAHQVGEQLYVTVHGAPSLLGNTVPAWMQFAFGYKPESQSVIALEHCRSALLQRLTGMAKSEDPKLRQQLQAQLERIRGTRHSSCADVVTAAIQDLHHLRNSTSSSGTTSTSTGGSQKSLTYIELLCEHSSDCEGSDDSSTGSTDNNDHYRSDNTVEHSSGRGRKLQGLAQLDQTLQLLYTAAPADTLFIVVTQGSLTTMKILASQKMRNRWEQAASKKGKSLVGRDRVRWEGVDEGRLIAAAAHATAGAVFLTRKED